MNIASMAAANAACNAAMTAANISMMNGLKRRQYQYIPLDDDDDDSIVPTIICVAAVIATIAIVSFLIYKMARYM